MKVIEKQIDNLRIIFLLVEYRFANYPNLVFSNNCFYQIPCQIGKKSYGLKLLKPKYHNGRIVYNVESKRIPISKLRKLSIKVNNEEIEINREIICPF